MHNESLGVWLHLDKNLADMHNLSLIQRLNIIVDVAFAIEYLHDYCQLPILHGNLKPSNVSLEKDMVAHVSDFNLANFLAVSQKQSSTIGVKGTICYVVLDNHFNFLWFFQ